MTARSSRNFECMQTTILGTRIPLNWDASTVVIPRRLVPIGPCMVCNRVTGNIPEVIFDCAMYFVAGLVLGTNRGDFLVTRCSVACGTCNFESWHILRQSYHVFKKGIRLLPFTLCPSGFVALVGSFRTLFKLADAASLGAPRAMGSGIATITQWATFLRLS